MAETAYMNTGVKISGAAHAALIVWMAVGGLFSFGRPDRMEFSEVTLVTGEEFAAMIAAGSAAPPDVPNSPAVPDVPQPAEVAPEAPAPETQSEPAEAPVPAEAAPETSEPAPEFDDTFEVPQAEVAEEAPPTPTPPDVSDGAAMVLAPDAAPAPRAAPRIAPEPAAAPEPDAAIADEVQEARRSDETAASEAPADPQEATAPEEATTRIVPDAVEDAGGTQVALAPAETPRPASRPKRPAPTPASQPAQTPTREAPAPAEPEVEDPIAAAVAEAVAEESSPTGNGAGEAQAGNGTARTGPPMTAGEKDALRIGVQRCWNIGSLSSEAQRVTVTVFVRMTPDARPDVSSIQMIDFDGGPEAAANRAYEAARRAIIRCGSDGYDLPPEKFGQWQEIEMVFNPENMRIR
ncbi:energy transducer TonB [Tropicimonas isoalkanivorans]|nr:energy transducer TonB [Tropicimonas isoalkanivorans]